MASLRLLLLFPLLLSFSTTSTVFCGKIVTHLPGFNGSLPFHLETGYETVGSWELFYYFMQSEGNPSEDPIIVWLSGGPGCSSFTGLIFEIGPLRLVVAEYNSSLPTLVYHNHSWTKFANIIFLDAPVGTGFSFSSRPQADELSDTTTSTQCYKFLREWYKSHPRFLSNPLYVGGDSYGGKIVPLLAHHIADGNDVLRPFLNLKGYLTGNSRTGELVDMNSRVAYARNVGIISDELYEEIEEACIGEDHNSPNINNLPCVHALMRFEKFFTEIDNSNILQPSCQIVTAAAHETPVTFGNRRYLRDKFLLNHISLPSNFDAYCKITFVLLEWMNTEAMKEALHVKKGSVATWARCSFEILFTYKQDVLSTVKYHLDLTTRGYRALIYSGDKDLRIPFIGTYAWIKSLNLSVVEKWRSWHVDGQVAGYTEKFTNNLTFATVKNAGHTAPEHQPEACFAMLRRWISGDSL